MNFIGNEKVVSFLNKALVKESLGHAYLFTGPKSVGKFTLAKMFASSVISGKKEILFTNDIISDVLADLIVVSPEIEEKKGITKEKDITIEEIRQIQTKLALYPYKGKYKVLVIENAHKMNVNAQNGLLKLLEEPNPTSIIILVTDEEGGMLPTIISRCQKISFGLVEKDKLVEVSSNKEMISFSMGRPGILLDMLANNEHYERKSEDVKKLLSLARMSIHERLTMADELSKDIVKTIDVFSLWIWLIRSSKLEDENVPDFQNVYGGISKIEEAIDIIKRTNANNKLVIENLLLNWV